MKLVVICCWCLILLGLSLLGLAAILEAMRG